VDRYAHDFPLSERIGNRIGQNETGIEGSRARNGAGGKAAAWALTLAMEASGPPAWCTSDVLDMKKP